MGQKTVSFSIKIRTQNIIKYVTHDGKGFNPFRYMKLSKYAQNLYNKGASKDDTKNVRY